MTEQTGSAPQLDRIEEIDVQGEMEKSFLEYAYSVIYSRALPDARDGLKPVQRRILYMMTRMGLVPQKGHVKSARVVGEVMGKLHPHSDTAIYDALVRLAQNFNLRLPLVDGHGNFGSLDDGPAASRYTEARLTGAALKLTESLEEDVVDFIPNYDGTFEQPEVLPAAVPNLLVNGGAGIAVGMATNLAPHNLGEVVAGAIHLLWNPEASLEELQRFIPGPDLPGGGTIVGLSGVRDAYRTGRGAFRTRAKAHVEKLSPRKQALVVTELPHLVGPERVIEKIKQGVDAKRLAGISDVEDLSDRKNGLRLVITLKAGFSSDAVLESLYRHTPLEDSFSVNSVALVDGEPKTLSLKEMLTVYISHRVEVVTRRSRYRLRKRQERLHLVEGLLRAIVDIDEVIQLIRSSENSGVAKKRLQQVFDLSAKQAEHILELRLRALTKFSRIELEAERDELIAAIALLQQILGSKTRLKEVVAKEMQDVADTFATPRRTVLLEDDGTNTGTGKQRSKTTASLEVQDGPCTVLLSATGLALRIPPKGEQAEPVVQAAGKHSALSCSVDTRIRGQLAAILSDGTLTRFSPVDLPEAPRSSVSFTGGVQLLDYLGITDKGLRVVALASLETGTPLGMASAGGIIKRVSLDALPAKDRVEIFALKGPDRLVRAFPAPDGSEIALVSDNAQLLRMQAASVRVQGIAAGGMAGIKLADGAQLIYAEAIHPDDTASVVTVACSSVSLPGVEFCSAKISAWADFPAKGRATGGVRAQRFLKGEDHLRLAWVGTGCPRALNATGQPIPLPLELSRRDGSGQTLPGMPTHLGAAPEA